MKVGVGGGAWYAETMLEYASPYACSLTAAQPSAMPVCVAHSLTLFLADRAYLFQARSSQLPGLPAGLHGILFLAYSITVQSLYSSQARSSPTAWPACWTSQCPSFCKPRAWAATSARCRHGSWRWVWGRGGGLCARTFIPMYTCMGQTELICKQRA